MPYDGDLHFSSYHDTFLAEGRGSRLAGECYESPTSMVTDTLHSSERDPHQAGSQRFGITAGYSSTCVTAMC